MANLGYMVFSDATPGIGKRPVQYGHLLPFTLSLILADHSCPFLHLHQTLWSLWGRTSEAFFSFLSGCHYSAISGNVISSVLTPGTGIRPTQTGHPRPFARLLTVAFHLCPFGHRHQYLSFEKAGTSFAVSGKFFSSSHSFANKGNLISRLVSSGMSLFELQNGHPVPLARLLGLAGQTCPFSQRQKTGRFRCNVTCEGSRSPFFS